MEGQTVLTDDVEAVQKFCELLESSKQLFNGLRDLPQYGQRQWQPYFAKTFETYTKLWKFQQENRLALDRSYSLKRWQIGEIASKIGQLYYHYYLRTSETNYLNEAYQFYSAIRARNYYKNVHKENIADLMLKKHRYYVRFIVVCLLLNYKQDVSDLIKDLSRQVDQYRKILLDNEENEWEVVVKEIKNFPDSDPVEVICAKSYQKCQLTMRLMPGTLPHTNKGLRPILSLGDIIIVGNSPSQLKFSELTIDMFRMIQVLERAPGLFGNSDKLAKPDPTQETSNCNVKRDNPHKYLLYRPTLFQLLTFLSTAVKELPSSEVLLLYVSAHGSDQKSKKGEVRLQGAYNGGGVITCDHNKEDKPLKKQSTIKEIHCLHPADLFPFMRKPMMIIIDSDNASAFSNLPDLFGQPLVCLMAPEEFPNSMKDHYVRGRLLTNFLYSPLMAFMLVCGIDQSSDLLYESCSRLMDKAMHEIQATYFGSRAVDHNFLLFFGDDFLRLILLRFAFFYCTLRLHRAYKDSKFYPRSSPVFPLEDFVGNTTISKNILQIAVSLGVKGLFHEGKSA